ncbi:MAG: ATP-binding protein [Eubacteriales bacterium]|nr:ATP-binding protein [Eubacteriales bacterium]
MIQRQRYLESLIRALNTDFVKILSGVRRSGKSTLLQLFKQWLLESGRSPDQIIEISFEKFEDDVYKDGKVLHALVRERADKERKLYLLIDEVQEMPSWAKIINSLHVSFDIDIYLTGSNARMFSGEYLTYLAGRYLEIKIYPLSFAEYLDFKGLSHTDHLAVSFETYLRNGAFPATALSVDEQLIQTINQGLFDSIFTRDIILRGQIREPGSFMKVAKFLFENIGSQVSANNIANSLKAAGSSIKADTVDHYLTLMCDAFMLYPCDRYDLRGRARLKTNGKYYVVDTGIQNQLIGFDHSNKGQVLENIVFLELLRRGYQVFTGKNGAAEIDFMVQKGNQKFYIQVAWSIMDEQTRTREFSAFSGIQDVFPRYVMTLDMFDFSEQGIVHLNVFEFLLGRIGAIN